MARILEISGDEASVQQAKVSNIQFLASVLGDFRVHALSREDLPSLFAAPGGDDGPDLLPNSLLLATLHHCFAKHIPLSLSPDVLWYVIVNEVATHVRTEPERYRHLFSNSSGQVRLQVRDDTLVYGGQNNDWSAAIGLFLQPLRKHIAPEHVGLFVKGFSTSTVEAETAALVTFMDVVSCYYSFELMTLCGIPRIRLEGAAEDWRDLHGRAVKLSAMFSGLRTYFDHLLPVLAKLSAAAEGEKDNDFWKSIFKLSGGSGGPYINGWITAFLAHKQMPAGLVEKPKGLFAWEKPRAFGGFQQNEFPAHVSKVSFVWNYLRREIPMWFVSGILGVEWEEGFLRPRLGYGVLEPLGKAEGDIRRQVGQELPDWVTKAMIPPAKAWWQFWKK